MNRRDAAMIAHLDAIEGRVMLRFDAIDARLIQLAQDVAALKVDLAMHGHEGDA